jgi:hypothetical protein
MWSSTRRTAKEYLQRQVSPIPVHIPPFLGASLTFPKFVGLEDGPAAELTRQVPQKDRTYPRTEA